MKGRTSQKCDRRESGAGIVQGVLGLTLLISGIVGGTLFLANLGLTITYRDKIEFAASEAATYSASLPQGQVDAGRLAKNLLGQEGITIPEEVKAIDSGNSVTVDIRGNLSPIASNLPLLTAVIPVDYSFTAKR